MPARRSAGESLPSLLATASFDKDDSNHLRWMTRIIQMSSPRGTSADIRPQQVHDHGDRSSSLRGLAVCISNARREEMMSTNAPLNKRRHDNRVNGRRGPTTNGVAETGTARPGASVIGLESAST